MAGTPTTVYMQSPMGKLVVRNTFFNLENDHDDHDDSEDERPAALRRSSSAPSSLDDASKNTLLPLCGLLTSSDCANGSLTNASSRRSRALKNLPLGRQDGESSSRGLHQSPQTQAEQFTQSSPTVQTPKQQSRSLGAQSPLSSPNPRLPASLSASCPATPAAGYPTLLMGSRRSPEIQHDPKRKGSFCLGPADEWNHAVMAPQGQKLSQQAQLASGQDDATLLQQRAQQKPQKPQKPQKQPRQVANLEVDDDVSTLMIWGLDKQYTQEFFVADLTEAGFGPGRFDVVYLPFVLSRRECQGYAVINFTGRQTAKIFESRFVHHGAAFGRFQCQLRTAPAKHQGRDANLVRLMKVASKINNPRFAPLGLSPKGDLVPVSLLR